MEKGIPRRPSRNYSCSWGAFVHSALVRAFVRVRALRAARSWKTVVNNKIK